MGQKELRKIGVFFVIHYSILPTFHHSSFFLPFAIRAQAKEAAPLACATVSGISLGPWQHPARKTPSTLLLMGSSPGPSA
jgi:hypothetical protein